MLYWWMVIAKVPLPLCASHLLLILQLCDQLIECSLLMQGLCPVWCKVASV